MKSGEHSSLGDEDEFEESSLQPGINAGMTAIQQEPQADDAMMTIFSPRSKPELSKQEPFEWWVFSEEPYKPNIQVLRAPEQSVLRLSDTKHEYANCQILPREPALLEDVLEWMGGFGSYQTRVTYAALGLPWIATSFQSISTVFTSPLLPDSWFDGYDDDMKSQMKVMITSVYFIGWACGCQLAGNWGDRLGRRPTFFRVAIIQLIGGLLTCAMPEYFTYLLARFITGVGVGGFGIVSWVLASEFWGGSYRNAIACIGHTPYAMGLAIFSILALIMNYMSMNEWRVLALMANIPVILQLAFFRSENWVPESPRWLMCQHRTDEVVVQMEAACICSGRPLPDGWVLQGVVMETPKHSDEADEAVQIGLLGMCRMKYMPKWLCVMGFMWFATSFGYYGLIYNAENMGDRYTSSILGSLIEIPAYFACVKVLLVLGRRNGSCFFLATIGVGCTLCAFVPEGSWMVTVLGMVGKFGAAGAFDSVYIFATELFPTEVRNISMGTASTCARFGVLLAQPLIAIGGSFPLLCFGIACGAAALLSLTLPETLGEVMWDTVAEVIAHQDGTLVVASHDVTGEMEDMDSATVTLADVRRVLGDAAVAELCSAEAARGQTRSTAL